MFAVVATDLQYFSDVRGGGKREFTIENENQSHAHPPAPPHPCACNSIGV